MQSHQDTFGSDALKNRGHRRSDALGKSMPITTLLLNYTPSSSQISDSIRSDGRGAGDISPTQQELPPLYFPVHETVPDRDIDNVKRCSDQQQQNLDTDDELDVLEQEYEILVSECSSSIGGSDQEGDRRKSNSDEYISLVGNSKFYTPCLTCVGSAPAELAAQPSAINEMCRRLCTEECRLRLSLAGLVPPSESILKNRDLLEQYVKDTLKKSAVEKCNAPPKIPPRPVRNFDKNLQHDNTTPAVAVQAPGNIAIQRKQFLSNMLIENANLSSDEEDLDKQQPPKELLDIVTRIVVPSLTQESASSPKTATTSPNEHEQLQTIAGTIIDPHELEMLNDIRGKFEIAEALAKTSAMTSTSKIKQRLAARKLEIEMENATKLENTHADAHAHENTSVSGVDASKTQQTDLANNDNSHVGVNCSRDNAQGVADAVTKPLNSRYETPDVVSPHNDGPPRELLLYLVRMGSFNSAPKINNSDSQDDSLEIPKGLTTPELLQHCKHLRGENQPPLLTRFFLKPLSTFSSQMVSSDVTDGLRCLKLDAVSRVCSEPIADPNHIRLLQWNLLSQTLGQNNDGFVRCPVEALTWENRKFLIVQEILQNNPDIVCLQEVDHFKFLQNILATQKYNGIFFPKPDSPCLYIEENNGPDGCAIFFKRDKFELKNFETRILEVWRVQSNQVAIAANLQIKATKREICVCTTHLKARHGSLLSKLRNEQGRDLIRFVKQFAGDRSVLICGDFNAEPTEPVYSTILNCEFLHLASAYSDIRAESDECNNENATTKAKLESCDKVERSIQNEPPYTTWKIREDGEVCHTIDYVFYTKDNLKVKNCLEFPRGDEIGKNRTPSFQYPSDHFSLICDFEIIENPMGVNTQESSKDQ